MKCVNIVKPTVPCVCDNGERALPGCGDGGGYIHLIGLLEWIGCNGVTNHTDRVGICNSDGSMDDTRLGDPGLAGHLSAAIEVGVTSEGMIKPYTACSWRDDCDTCSCTAWFVCDNGNLSNLYIRDIGDGIV